METFLWCLFIFGGFLSGSVLYSKIITSAVLKKDVCELSSDGNPGTFNTFKHCGVKWGLLCLVLDCFKGFLPVHLAALFLDTQFWGFTLVIIAPVLGHAAGIFNGFRGGKCIAVSFGVLFGLLPVSYSFFFLAVPYIFFSALIKIRPNGLRSIVVFIFFGIISVTVESILKMPCVAAGCGLIAVIAVVKHAVKIKEEWHEYKFAEDENEEEKEA